MATVVLDTGSRSVTDGNRGDGGGFMRARAHEHFRSRGLLLVCGGSEVSCEGGWAASQDPRGVGLEGMSVGPRESRGNAGARWARLRSQGVVGG